MKRQYIIPSVIVCDMQEMQMVAASPNGAKISTNSAGNPYGENLDKSVVMMAMHGVVLPSRVAFGTTSNQSANFTAFDCLTLCTLHQAPPSRKMAEFFCAKTIIETISQDA